MHKSDILEAEATLAEKILSTVDFSMPVLSFSLKVVTTGYL